MRSNRLVRMSVDTTHEVLEVLGLCASQILRAHHQQLLSLYGTRDLAGLQRLIRVLSEVR